MGYSSRATGNITITPPLTWGDISDSPYLPERVNRDGNWRDVQYVNSVLRHLHAPRKEGR